MEEYKILLKQPFDDIMFSTVTRVSPESTSFFTSIGIGTLESLIRLYNYNQAEQSIKLLNSELMDLKQKIPLLKSKTALQSIGLLIKLISGIESDDLSYLHNQIINNSKMLLAISEGFKFILERYMKHIDTENFKLKQDYIHYYSSKLKIFYWVFEEINNESIKTKLENRLPLVFLLKEIRNDREVYSVLYHKNTNKSIEPNESFPFIWEDNQRENIRLNVKYSEDKKYPIDKTYEQIIEVLSNVLLEVNVSARDRAIISEISEKCEFTDSKFKISFKGDSPAEEDNLPSSISRYHYCNLSGKNSQRSTDIICLVHNLCSNCRNEYYNETIKSYCESCNKEIAQAGIELIKLFD